MEFLAHATGWVDDGWGWPMWLAMTIGMTAMVLTLLAIVWLIVRAVGASPRAPGGQGARGVAGSLRAR